MRIKCNHGNDKARGDVRPPSSLAVLIATEFILTISFPITGHSGGVKNPKPYFIDLPDGILVLLLSDNFDDG